MKRNRFLNIFTAVICLFSVGSALENQTGNLYEPYLEWEIEYTSASDNKFDVVATATFEHTSGTAITTEMFYDGNDTWKFRFTGTKNGTWTLTTNGPGTLGGHTATVTINDNMNNRNGFIKAIPHSQGARWGWSANNNSFIPQYVMGKPLTLFLNENSPDTTAINNEIQEFVVEHGFTGFHFESFIGTDKNVWLDSSKDPDIAVFRAAEKIILETYNKGGATHLWLLGSDAWKDNSGDSYTGFKTSEWYNLCRYVAARLAPLPGWTMGYGFDVEDDWVSSSHLQEWQDYMQSKCGWQHFFGARVCNNNSYPKDDYCTWTGGDYLGYTRYLVGYEKYKQDLAHRSNVPSFEEDRYRIRDKDQFNNKDYHVPEWTRKGMWHSALAGGVANIWGNLTPHNDNHQGSNPYDNKGLCTSSGERVNIKHLIKTYSLFWENRFLTSLKRNNSIIVNADSSIRSVEDTGLCVGMSDNAGEHYIMYKENTSTLSIDLTGMKGSQPAVAVDAKASYSEIDLGTINPQIFTWNAPDTSDWAIAIGDFDASSTTSADGSVELYPKGFALYNNYPNPFNASTTIVFSLPKKEFVNLKVYDALGREIETLAKDTFNAGSHKIHFSTVDFNSGVYFYRLEAGKNYSETKKMVHVK